jgi:hypothetical protein
LLNPKACLGFALSWLSFLVELTLFSCFGLFFVVNSFLGIPCA